MTDPHKKELERVRRKIENSEKIGEEDYEVLNILDKKLTYNKVGDGRHAQVLGCVSRIARRRDAHGVSLQATLESQAAVEDLLQWIEGGEYEDEDKTHEWGEKTKGHYRSTLRKFGRVVNDGDLPPTMEIVYGGDKKKIGDKVPKRWQILLWDEDVTRLLDACANDRDRALIAIAWDTGARPHELFNLTYENISPDGDFLTILVGGKNTPLREVRLVASVPFVKNWLEKKHPANETEEGFTPETSLWPHLNKNESLALDTFRSKTSTIADRIDFKKPANLRHFRKSRASVLASREEIGRGDLEEWHGWRKGSKIPAVYIKRFGKAAANKIAKSDGLREEDLPKSDHEELAAPAPVRCPNCSRWTPRYTNECLWCVTVFDPSSVVEAKPAVKVQAKEKINEEKKTQVRSEVIEMVSNGELSAANIETAKQVSEVLATYPELLDHADTLKDILDDEEDEDDGGAAPAGIID